MRGLQKINFRKSKTGGPIKVRGWKKIEKLISGVRTFTWHLRVSKLPHDFPGKNFLAPMFCPRTIIEKEKAPRTLELMINLSK